MTPAEIEWAETARQQGHSAPEYSYRASSQSAQAISREPAEGLVAFKVRSKFQGAFKFLDASNISWFMNFDLLLSQFGLVVTEF